MPNPFSNKSSADTPDEVEITNSTLVCDECWENTAVGTYYPQKKLLVFTCPNGHINEVKNIEI